MNASKPIESAGLGAVLYAIICYAVGVAGLGYCVLFLLGVAVPTTIGDPATMHWATALAINLALVLGWGVQHSAMARPRFKRWLTRFIPRACERVTYCLASGITLAAVCILWQPIHSPHMTVSHLLFAAMMTLYIHVGLHFEERALLRQFGEDYADYMRRVPKLLPRLFPRAAAGSGAKPHGLQA